MPMAPILVKGTKCIKRGYTTYITYTIRNRCLHCVNNDVDSTVSSARWPRQTHNIGGGEGERTRWHINMCII